MGILQMGANAGVAHRGGHGSAPAQGVPAIFKTNHNMKKSSVLSNINVISFIMMYGVSELI